MPGTFSLAEVQVEPALAKLLPDARGRCGVVPIDQRRWNGLSQTRLELPEMRWLGDDAAPLPVGDGGGIHLQQTGEGLRQQMLVEAGAPEEGAEGGAVQGIASIQEPGWKARRSR